MYKTFALKKVDIIIIAAVLLASLSWLAVLAWRDGSRDGDYGHGLRAEIHLDGQLLQNIALADGERELRLESAAGYNVLQVGSQGIRIVESDCHNQDCVHTGMQSRPGSIIACLPHRLLIRLSGEKGAEFDAVSR